MSFNQRTPDLWILLPWRVRIWRSKRNLYHMWLWPTIRLLVFISFLSQSKVILENSVYHLYKASSINYDRQFRFWDGFHSGNASKFSVNTTPEKFKNATISGYSVWICVWVKLGHGKSRDYRKVIIYEKLRFHWKYSSSKQSPNSLKGHCQLCNCADLNTSFSQFKKSLLQPEIKIHLEIRFIFRSVLLDFQSLTEKPVFECPFAQLVILFLSYLVKNSIYRASGICKLPMEWYVMRMCASCVPLISRDRTYIHWYETKFIHKRSCSHFLFKILWPNIWPYDMLFIKLERPVFGFPVFTER